MKHKTFHMLSLFVIGVFVLISVRVGHASEKPIEFNWVQRDSIPNVDPIRMNGNSGFVIGPNLYDTLIYPDVEKKYIPWIADSWKISTDGLKYTFQLKQGIPFHDMTEITAEDVVFSMDRMVTVKESVIGTHFRYIKPGSTKALDKYTVEFNLTERAPQFMVSLFLFKILSKNTVLKNKEEGPYGEFGDYGLKYLQSKDAGSGPFMSLEHKIGSYFKMKRFKDYPFEPTKPNSIDIATIHGIPELVTAVTKFKAGELDMGIWIFPAKTLKELQKDERFIVNEEYTPAVWTMAMNNTKPPLDDVYVRKAIAHAFDVETVTKHILTGGLRIRGPIPPVLGVACTDIPYYPFDLKKAKALLKKSKYSIDELKKIEMVGAPVGDRFLKVFLMLASNLKKIGLNLKIKPSTWPDMVQHQTKPETAYHFALVVQTAKVPHQLQILNYFTKKGWGIAWPLGGMYYSNQKVTEAIKQASHFTDLNEQARYYCIAQQLIAEDSPAIFSHVDQRLLPFWRYVKGYKHPVGAEFFNLRFNRFTIDTNDPLFKKNHR